MGVWYCTREDVKSALDSAETARNNWQVDNAIDGATRSVEGLLHRQFRPVLGTRYFDWPDLQRGRPWRLWLNGSELVSLTSMTAGGVAIPTANLFLEPANYGPPYNSIEIDLSTASAFSAGDTHQRAIAVVGLWAGCANDEEQVGTLSADLAGTTSATAAISWSTPRIGVGDVLRIDSERMVVAERSMVDTTQNLQADMAASSAAVTVAVTTGTAFAAGQVLLVDSERMLVVDVAGNNVTVKRAWDGSVLAAHTTGADVYALTGTDVDRAQLGTTIAAHTSTTAIYRHKVPGLVRQLTAAEAINDLLQSQGGYARVQRSADAQQSGFGEALDEIRKRARAAYGRKARTAAI